jgi:glucosyl-dolichyl phosphate glucuronosyltransferase
MITVVVPTINRPNDLLEAVNSIISQTYLPDELIIVDQSIGVESKLQIDLLMGGHKDLQLNYIHDSSISGLVAAKLVAANVAKGDVVCFLEDDIVLEADFIEQIIKGFEEQPGMLGCCGIVTNMPKQLFLHKFFFKLFHRNIFQDKRIDVYGEIDGKGHKLIRSQMISGGLSAWRREVFSTVPFDPASGYFMLEDIDFSTRVEKHFGPHLYINPNARLVHNCSPVNREAFAPRHRRKMFEYILFYQNRRGWPNATISLFWLLLGLFFESIFMCVCTQTLWPIKECFLGIRKGILG